MKNIYVFIVLAAIFGMGMLFGIMIEQNPKNIESQKDKQELLQETELESHSLMKAPCGHIYMPSELALCDTCVVNIDEYEY